jgi:hypothetical protein
MHRALLSALVAGLATAALLVTGIAAAAISPTYNVTGFVTAATSTHGSLAGTGSGSGGDRLVWGAEVDYTALSTDPAAPAAITGGTFSATSRGGGRGGAVQLAGQFTGGTVTYDSALSSRATCGTQVYDVDATLAFEGWTGTFSAQITQRQLRLFGRCFTILVTVSGQPGLVLTAVAASPPPTTPPPPPPATPPPPPPPPTTPPPGGEF